MFRWFLDTKETIPDGVGFHQFDGIHFLWLAAAVVLCVAAACFYRKADPEARNKMRRVVAALLVADELFKTVMLLVGGRYLMDYLPLHLCSINIFVALSHAIRPTQLKAEFLYALSLPAAIVAMLCPSWTGLPFWNFMHLHSTTVHILLIMYPVMLLAGREVSISPRLLSKCFLIILCMGAVIYPLNKLLGTNFMFLNRPGSGNPLVLFERWLGTPWYILGIPVMLGAVWALMYLPVIAIRERRMVKQH